MSDKSPEHPAGFIEPAHTPPVAIIARVKRLIGVLPHEMHAATRRHLDDLFAVDIRHTGLLTGLDLREWLATMYHEPMCVRPIKDQAP